VPSEPPVLGTKSDRKKHLRDQETWWIQRAEEREESKNDENVDQLATSRHTGGPGPLSDCCFVRQSNYYAWCAGWSSAVIQPDSRPIAHPRTILDSNGFGLDRRVLNIISCENWFISSLEAPE
ncbi:hypothetical protein X801_04774, partial [Opisthorchis viverrini]